jgi:hypothetical protein
VFCVSIGHADRLAEAFQNEGVSCASIHSGLTVVERDRLLESFDRGEIRVLTNVNVLTEGWDSPRADCVLLCRPTLSTALYVQMVGRGLRVHPAKKDCLVLDLAGCFVRHGSIRRPIVRIDGQALPMEGQEVDPTRRCPGCEEAIPLSTFSCPYCQADLGPKVEEVDHEQNMVIIDDQESGDFYCDSCGRAHDREACSVEWHSYEPTSSMPGLIYCPEDHPLQPLDPIRPLDSEGKYRIAHLKSRLQMDGGDVSLGISLFLMDEQHHPFITEVSFGEGERSRMEDFFSNFTEASFQGEDTIALVSEIKRTGWDFSGWYEVTQTGGRWEFRPA